MTRRWRISPAVSLLVLSVAVRGECQVVAKKPVNGQTDLPRFTYSVEGSASQLVEADEATFNRFALKVRADLDGILRDYDIHDKSTMRRLLGAKLDMEELAGNYPAALATVDSIRALQEKPAQKLVSGLLARARLEAEVEANARSGPAVERAFSRHYQEAIHALPWNVVEDSIKYSYASARLTSRDRKSVV